MNLTIQNIIEKLKESGTNSKRQVIEALENATKDDLKCLATDCIFRVVLLSKLEDETNVLH